MPTVETKKTVMTGLDQALGQLKELSAFTPEEKEIPSLTPLPEEKDFLPPNISKGIKLARAASILAAGMQDPQIAMQMMQTFKQKDLAARESAQLAYRNALGVAAEKREEEKFRVVEGRQQVASQTDIANTKIRAIEASIQAITIQMRASDDPQTQAQHLNTIAELQALHEAVIGPQAKPLQFKSIHEAALGGAIKGQDVAKALREGTAPQLLAEINQRLIAEAPIPKALISREQYQGLIASAADPAAKTYIEAVFATAPDTRTDLFGNPADSVTWASSLRKLMETDPAAFEKSVSATVDAYVAAGMVSDAESAETFLADVVAKRADPEHDARIQPPGTFKVKPVGPPAPSKIHLPEMPKAVKETGGGVLRGLEAGARGVKTAVTKGLFPKKPEGK
jgi:hypothetical protein